MVVTRRKQRRWNQNIPQPIYRLSPELISEIFLRARPLPCLSTAWWKPDPRQWVWGELMRYLVTTTSITRHLRRIALDCGELWSFVGFCIESHVVNVKEYCKNALVIVEAFLGRTRGCNLHFFFHTSHPHSAPAWFYPKLVGLIRPQIRRVRSFNLRQRGADSTWKQLCFLLNEAVNINKLSL